MKVEKINNVLFRSSNQVTKPVCSDSDEIKITELKNITPDYGVKIPQKYAKLGVKELENGLKLYSYKLSNGHRVTVIPMPDSPATVKNYVNVGSMNETDDIKGISHFLEHMAFNGTDGSEGYIKLNRGDSFKKVDEMGGWTNASTNYSLTDYVNSTPLLGENDLEKQMQIIAAMAEDLTLSSDMVEKEKFPVCSEIDMILDSPETIAVDQTVRSLFNIKSSADELVGGSVNHIQKLDRQKVLDYYNKYYTPDNMHLVITGDVEPDKVIELAAKTFHSNKVPSGKRFDEKLTPITEKVRKDYITDKTTSANIVIGLAGPKTNDVKTSIVAEVAEKYINSSEVGLREELKKRNVSNYSGIEKISTNPNNPTFLYFQAECAEEKVEEALKIYFDKLSTLKTPDEKTLANIKKSLIMSYENCLEDSIGVNTMAGKSAFDGNLDYLTNYESILNSVTTADVREYIDKYIDMSKAAISVVHPETDEETIIDNYNKAQTLSFRGKHRCPIDTNKVSETVLDNNYKIAFSESKNGNVPFELNLYYDLPQGTNPALINVLDAIYTKGTKNQTEKEFLKFQEQNNLSVGTDVYSDNLSIDGYSSADNFEKTVAAAKELMANPRITEEEVKEAVERIRERLSRYDNSSRDLYEFYEAPNNPYYFSNEEILKGLDKVTVQDVKNLHEYIMNNSKGIITINVPEKSSYIKDRAKTVFAEYDAVEPYSHERRQIYKETEFPVVLTEARNVSQADISETFKFKIDGSIKEKVTAYLMNDILSSSDSIGLFNSLRERDHLAYRVNSSLDISDDLGEVSLRILTSTDNKDTGITSYDNVQKSIDGFNRQINMLLNSEYNDFDLETAKRSLKAGLLNKESVYSRLSAIKNAQRLDVGLDYENRVFEAIDSITREDIDNMSKRVFANSPIYSIVASQDTLDANKEFLNGITSEKAGNVTTC